MKAKFVSEALNIHNPDKGMGVLSTEPPDVCKRIRDACRFIINEFGVDADHLEPEEDDPNYFNEFVVRYDEFFEGLEVYYDENFSVNNIDDDDYIGVDNIDEDLLEYEETCNNNPKLQFDRGENTVSIFYTEKNTP